MIAEENWQLQGSDADNGGIDFSSIITATDADGDMVVGAAPGSFTVAVQDDIPEALEPDTIPQNANIVLVLDNSGSMYSSQPLTWDSAGYTRAAALSTSVAALLTSLATDTALGSTYQVHIVEYNSQSSPIGTFTIQGGTPGSESAAVAALANIQNPNVDGVENNQYTNYEAGFQQALDWVQNGDPLGPGDVTGDLSNRVIFVSDGDPNKFNDPDGIGDNFSPGGGSTTNAATALGEVTGSDGTNELEMLTDTYGYTVRSVGISVNSGQEGQLDQLDSTGQAENITSADELVDVLPSLISETAPIIKATVEEEDLDSSDTSDPDPDDNADGIDDDSSVINDEDSGLAGDLGALFQPGADEILTYSLNPDDAELPTLYSGGETVVYSFSGDTLTATAGGEPIFTFTVQADGSWSFDLDGNLDHVEGDGQNFDLQADGGPVEGIDLSSIILATDADGDAVPAAAGAFVVEVQDDVPVAENDVQLTFGYGSYKDPEGELRRCRGAGDV